MRDILLIVGLSGSGKDYLSKQLVSNHGFNNMVSYTTRPMRDGETEGVEYHFIKSNEEFDKLVESGEIFEQTEYHTAHGLWKYGYGKKSVPMYGYLKNVAIVNPDGVRQFLENEEIKKRVCIVDVHSPNHMRLEQICNRYGGLHNMTDKQMCEAFRREVEDAEPFYDYFQSAIEPKNDKINWTRLFNGVPFDNWEHEYDGLSNDLLNRIENMMSFAKDGE